MADIYTKATMNKIYNKLNIASKKNCKSANENTIDFQKCYHQAMAINARNMAIKIRTQVEGACRNEKNTEKCVQKIQSLINYSPCRPFFMIKALRSRNHGFFY